MAGTSPAMTTGRGGIAVAFLLLALAMRVLVPTGWMPSTDGRAITLCTGMGAVQAWVADDGTIHEKAPGDAGDTAAEPCVFAGLAAAVLAPDFPAAVVVPAATQTPLIATAFAVAVGRGLAAPPPPPTGPPATL